MHLLAHTLKVRKSIKFINVVDSGYYHGARPLTTFGSILWWMDIESQCMDKHALCTCIISKNLMVQ